MKHRVSGYILNRDSEHRTAMFRNLVAGLFEHGQITTTKQKAKAVQPFAEKLITLARRGDLHARRRVVALLRDRIMCDDEEKITRNRYGEVVSGPKLIRHLFENIAPRYHDRPGGYTRIVKLGEHRLGDGGDLVMLQLVGEEGGPEIGGLYSPRREKARRRRDYAERVLAGRTGATAAVASEQSSPASAPAESSGGDEQASDSGEQEGEVKPGE